MNRSIQSANVRRLNNLKSVDLRLSIPNSVDLSFLIIQAIFNSVELSKLILIFKSVVGRYDTLYVLIIDMIEQQFEETQTQHKKSLKFFY